MCKAPILIVLVCAILVLAKFFPRARQGRFRSAADRGITCPCTGRSEVAAVVSITRKVLRMSDGTSVRTNECEKIKVNETAKTLAEDLGVDNPLMVSDQGPAPQVGDVGVVKSVNTSPKKGMRKAPVEAGVIELVRDYGVADDAHAGDWHRQVSFLAEESIDVARENGLDVGYGDFAENVTTSGINIKEMPLGTLVKVGTATVEISQIGKVCHTRCAIYYLAGDCIFPREGVFGWVVEPGEVRIGDEIRVLSLGEGEVHRALSQKPLG